MGGKLMEEKLNSLIIGSSSQLSRFFPDEYERISSRNIDFEKIKNKNYDRIYILFAEQRTFLNESLNFFLDTNLHYTIEVINNLLNVCNKIIVYSTSELWNKYDGCVSIETKYNYGETPYIKSKELMCNYINENKDKYQNVIIIYPFNFNSVYRKEGFLFSKIFDSLINNKKITIGDVDFFRDLIHPSIITKISIEAEKDVIIGSGSLINVKDFIKDLYKKYGKDFESLVNFNNKNNLKNIRNNYYSCIKYSSYEELLKKTINDLYEYKIS